MDKDRIIEDFFRGLRVALTNAFSYPKDHPYFIKSVESFKLKIEALLAAVNPFKIGVTSSGIVVDGKNLNKSGFYDELARLLHQRKIKTIEIRSGADLQELVRFLGLISMPQKDIFKSGGLGALLEKEKLAHFTVQELDYSAFLHGEGQECADIWGYMLKEAVYTDNTAKIEQLADSFGALIKRVNEKEFFDSEGISAEVGEFLVKLRDKNKAKFDKCLNDVFLWLLRNKKTLSQDNLDKLRPVFNGLDKNEFSNLLKEGLLQEDNFDSLSLQLFSKISEQEDPQGITKNFFNRIQQDEDLKDNPVVVKKVRSLLSNSQDDMMSAVYRNTLDSLVKNISFSGKLIFDHRSLQQNYRYILLGILATDKNPAVLQTSANILEKELFGIFEDRDTDLLKDIRDVLKKREEEYIQPCIDLKKKIAAFVENVTLKGDLPAEQEFLLDMISSAGEELNLYLDKIFVPEKVNKQVLGLFLRLFTADMEVFYVKLDQGIQDTEFLASLIDSLSQIDSPVSINILKYIYSAANELIKSQSLKAMHKLGKVDADFLKKQLTTNSVTLRSNLVSVLMLDAKAKSDTLEVLFGFPSFMGSKNKLLIENMQIVFELNFTEAAVYIKEFGRRRFFWNRQLRDKAAQILREWNVN
ncbi:MAG: hypothetical protein PHW98_07605 [Candidatus Omnitrophica bacterium]|nr:hypothetical protein [Candidatus Omnitrophota bacterium]